jgi:transposase
MSYLCGVSRQQMMLLPESVEDYVGPENPVRVIDAFVDGLDLGGLGFEVKAEQAAGAPPYDPKALLKLYIYGYLNRIRSSRDLEKATRRNLEVIWLLGRLTPDHWTINAFRRTNRKHFKEVFRQFNLVCGSLGLFGAELVAIDGTFLKAVNSRQRNFTHAKVQRMMEEIDRRTEAYLKELDAAEPEAPGQSLGAVGGDRDKGAAHIQSQLAALEQKRRECAALLEELSKEPGAQLSLTDPDSRTLRKKSECTVGYNAQIAVDAAHHLIAAEEVTCEPNDSALLAPMAAAASEALGVEKIAAVADSGYYSIEQIKRCAEEGVEAYVPAPRTAAAGEGQYPIESFRYDAPRDLYICPQGRELTRHSDTVKSSGRYHVYYDSGACGDCPVRERCTRGAYRKLAVHEHQEFVDAARTRLRERPQVMAQRRALAEHPFGTMKFWLGYRAFLNRGLEMVRAEFSLTCLAYNLRRTLNLLGVRQLLATLRAKTPISAPLAA